MANDRTTVTELGTALGMLGYATIEEAIQDRPRQMVDIDDALWRRLRACLDVADLRLDFHAAFTNGQAFLRSVDGLRGRPPLLIEWKGSQRAPGDDVVPADLRVDHVYLVSCKYLSRILINASPSHLFDRALAGGYGVTSPDWYLEVAPNAYQALYETVREALPPRLELPPFVSDLTALHRSRLRDALRAPQWPTQGVRDAVRAFSLEVGRASAERWRGALVRKADRLAMLWRLLRIGSAPYFVLGTSRGRSLRLRVLTPWDWRATFELRSFDAWGDDAGQPIVRWKAVARHRIEHVDYEIAGHVQVRWSHGRFAQPPEAKVYLDTPHQLVAGYVSIDE